MLGYGLAGLILFVVLVAVSVYVAFQKSASFQGWVFSKMMPSEALPERATYRGFTPDGTAVRSAADIYRSTNLWTVHFHFTAAEYAALGPNRIPMAPMQQDGNTGPVLRNPRAQRNGLAGMLGFEFPWSAATVEIGGRTFTNVGVRFKGNGTFLGGVSSYKKPLKIEFDHTVKEQNWGGRTVLNLGNLSADFTCLSDALAYEFFRDAGVLAPRTAYARVFHTIEGRNDAQDRLLGLYSVIENPDSKWAAEAFGTKGVALFKPVTTSPFADLGRDWTNYHAIYDPKTKTTTEQQQRIIDFAQLVSHGTDSDFNRQVGEFLDLEQAARFFACEVLLANYDGILSQGQNYLVFLEPQGHRMGFIPWDLDHSWGEFPFIGTADQREQCSIEHPWVSQNRFLERLWVNPDFKRQYRGELTRLLETLFVPARLERRIDELAVVIRPAVAEMAPLRIERFERAISSNVGSEDRDPPGRGPMDSNRPAWQLKRFIRARADHVRRQLAGEVTGITPPRMNL